jgi:chromate transporter
MLEHRNHSARPFISVRELVLLFAWLGAIGFGGGMAVIALMEREIVQRRSLVVPEEFLHGVALGQLPGVAGALVATLALFLPAIILMSLLAHSYTRLKDVHQVQNVLSGLTSVVVGLVLAAAIALAPAAFHGPAAPVLCALALVLLSRFKWHPAFVLALGAAAGPLGIIR